MLSKKKGDRVPKENIRGNSPRDMTVESWLRNRELWNSYANVQVQPKDFVVDEENGCLYVKKTAKAADKRWITSGRGNVVLWRIHDGWLRGEYPDHIKFKTDDVKDSKSYLVINMLYKLVKVDDTIPITWWNED